MMTLQKKKQKKRYSKTKQIFVYVFQHYLVILVHVVVMQNFKREV